MSYTFLLFMGLDVTTCKAELFYKPVHKPPGPFIQLTLVIQPGYAEFNVSTIEL